MEIRGFGWRQGHDSPVASTGLASAHTPHTAALKPALALLGPRVYSPNLEVPTQAGSAEVHEIDHRMDGDALELGHQMH